MKNVFRSDQLMVLDKLDAFTRMRDNMALANWAGLEYEDEHKLPNTSLYQWAWEAIRCPRPMLMDQSKRKNEHQLV